MDLLSQPAQTGTSEVKGEGKSLGEIEFPIFASAQEAVDCLGEEQLLGLLNTQIKTTCMNEHRQAHSTKITKGKLREMAFARISAEEFAGAAQDPGAINALIAQKIQEVEAEVNEAKAKVAAASSPSEGGED